MDRPSYFRQKVRFIQTRLIFFRNAETAHVVEISSYYFLFAFFFFNFVKDLLPTARSAILHSVNVRAAAEAS